MIKLFSESKMLSVVAIAVTFVLLTGSNFFSNDFKFSKSLGTVINTGEADEQFLVWVEFVDKGEDAGLMLASPEMLLTKESLKRRMKVKPADQLADFSDIPLSQSYVADIVNLGLQVKQRSKWFNRISCYANAEQLHELADLGHVRKLDLVKTFTKNYDYPETPEGENMPESIFNETDNANSFNYGSSLAQMQIINAVMTHDSGYYGQGVLVASFDAGVDNIEHPCFDSIRARGYRSYDFVNHDTIVDDQSGQQGQGYHGTNTLSLVVGYRPGNLISPAFRSNVIIAKTENTDSETPVEEDNWIAAAEWADSL
ncbi:MAG: hypothetical protein WBC65_03435, partial [Ignavibacteria bacterium]